MQQQMQQQMQQMQQQVQVQQQMQQQMQQQVQEMQQQVQVQQQMQQGFAQIQQQLRAIQATTTNIRAFNANRRAYTSQATDAALVPLAKVEADVGAGLPGYPPQLPGPPTIGDRPPFFPGTLGALRALTKQQISNLTAYYNEDFGMEAGDTVPVLIQKVESWLCGY
jgi:TolA-binding protein